MALGTFDEVDAVEPAAAEQEPSVSAFQTIKLADYSLDPVGLINPRNIDLNKTNAEQGLLSFQFSEDGANTIVIPLVSEDGKRILSKTEAIANYRATNRHLGIFDSPENADAYSKQLHTEFTHGQNQGEGTFPPAKAPAAAQVAAPATSGFQRIRLSDYELDPLKAPLTRGLTVRGITDPASVKVTEAHPQDRQVRGFTDPASVKVTEPPQPQQIRVTRGGEIVKGPVPPLGSFPLLDAPITGAQQAARGVVGVAKALGDVIAHPPVLPAEAHTIQPSPHDTALLGPTNDIIEGVFGMMTPVVVAGAITNPLVTGAVLAGGMAAQQAATKGAEALGMSQEQARFAGNLGAILGGAAGGRAVRGTGQGKALFGDPQAAARKAAAEVLGVDPNADAATVRSAWIEAAKANHPDTNPGVDPAKMADINLAYEWLKDHPSTKPVSEREAASWVSEQLAWLKSKIKKAPTAPEPTARGGLIEDAIRPEPPPAGVGADLSIRPEPTAPDVGDLAIRPPEPGVAADLSFTPEAPPLDSRISGLPPTPGAQPPAAVQTINLGDYALNPVEETPAQATAVFLGHAPSGPLYNITGGPADRSTVSADRLTELGIAIPETPEPTGQQLSGAELRARALAARQQAQAPPVAAGSVPVQPDASAGPQTASLDDVATVEPTAPTGTAAMTFDEFAKVYRATFAKMMSYSPKQAGSAVYVEKLAALADTYPEWAKHVEDDVATAEKPSLASTQVDLPDSVAKPVLALGKTIAPEHLAEQGLEQAPHITVKYGLTENVPDALRALVQNEPPITVTLGKTGVFPASESGGDDVLYAEVDSPDLVRLNQKIAEAFPSEDTHPTYVPHVTVAYLKPGEGARYAGNTSLVGQKVTLNSLTFSGTDEAKTVIRLQGPQKGQKATPEPIATTPVPAGTGAETPKPAETPPITPVPTTPPVPEPAPTPKPAPAPQRPGSPEQRQGRQTREPAPVKAPTREQAAVATVVERYGTVPLKTLRDELEQLETLHEEMTGGADTETSWPDHFASEAFDDFPPAQEAGLVERSITALRRLVLEREGQQSFTARFDEIDTIEPLPEPSEAPTVGKGEPDAKGPTRGGGVGAGQLPEPRGAAPRPSGTGRPGALGAVPSEHGEAVEGAGPGRPGEGDTGGVVADGVSHPPRAAPGPAVEQPSGGSDVPASVALPPAGTTHDPSYHRARSSCASRRQPPSHKARQTPHARTALRDAC